MEQEIISYVVPLYPNGGLIAVAGIDILFSELTDLIDEAQVLRGYGFLCGKDIKELTTMRIRRQRIRTAWS